MTDISMMCQIQNLSLKTAGSKQLS